MWNMLKNNVMDRGDMMSRFVLVNYECEVSVLDTFENENLLMFGLSLEDEEGAKYIETELAPIVDCLNEQDRRIRELEERCDENGGE